MFCCFQVPSREELRQYILPIALQSELQNDKRPVVNSLGDATARHPGRVHDDSILNTSIGSLSESGYEGDMEDEGDVNVDDVMLDEELCNELADGDNGVLNKQSKDSSFLNWDQFSRTSSTPSILHPAGLHGGFDFDLQDMETDSEPVLIDNSIHSASELCVPVVMEPEDVMEFGESCSKPVASNRQRRQPLRSIENNNISDRASFSWKSQQRTTAWSRSVMH